MGFNSSHGQLWRLFLLFGVLGLVYSQPVKEQNATACLPSKECVNDKSAVFAYYRNQTFCCQAGNAISMSLSGPGFKFVKTFFSQVYKGNESSNENMQEESGGISKRDTTEAEERKNNMNITFECTCTPYDYGEDITSFRDIVSDFYSTLRQAMSDLYE